MQPNPLSQYLRSRSRTNPLLSFLSSRSSVRRAIAAQAKPEQPRYPSLTTASTVANQERALQAAGIDTTPPPPRKGLLQRALDVLDTLGRPVRTFVGEAIRTGNVRQAASRAAEAFRSPEKALSGEDILNIARQRGLPVPQSRLGRFLASTAVEIALDPTSYIGIGELRSIGQAVGKAVRRPSLRLLGEAAAKAGEELPRARTFRVLSEAGKTLRTLAKEVKPEEVRAVSLARARLAQALKAAGQDELARAFKTGRQVENPLLEAARKALQERGKNLDELLQRAGIRAGERTSAREAAILRRAAERGLDVEALRQQATKSGRLPRIETPRRPRPPLQVPVPVYVRRQVEGPQYALKVLGRPVVRLPSIQRVGSALVRVVPGGTVVQDVLGRLFKFNYIPSSIRGTQRVALQEAQARLVRGVKRAGFEASKGVQETVRQWRGVSPEAAREAAYIIEEPARQAKLAQAGQSAVPPLVQPTPENVQAAERAKALFKRDLEAAQKAGIDIRAIEHYVTHLYSDAPAKVREVLGRVRQAAVYGPRAPFFTKERTIDLLEEAEKQGLHPITDVRILTAVHRALTDQMVVLHRMIRDIKSMGPAVVSKQPRAGYIQVTNSISKELNGLWMHPEVAATIRNLMPVLLNRDEGMRMLERAFDSAMNAWKSLAVGMSPAFHVRQFFGNLLLNLADGVWQPERYAQAVALLTGALKRVRLAGREYTRDQILDMFGRFGLRGSGAFSELRSTASVTEEARRALELLNRGGFGYVVYYARHPFSIGRDLGELGDTLFRFTNFLHHMDRGLNPEAAAQAVRRALFDYSELTPAEKAIRRYLIPFYSWRRKALPRLVERLLGAPGLFSGYGHVQAGLFREAQRQAEEQGFGGGWVRYEDLPYWMKQAGFLPLWVDAQGNVHFINLNLPIQELEQIPTTPVPAEDLFREFVGQTNPLAQTLYSLATNQDIFTGRPITQTPSYPTQSWRDYGAYVLSRAGPLAQSLFTDPRYQQAAEQRAAAQLAEGTGQEIPPEMQPQKRALGLLRRYNPVQLARQRLYERADQLRQLREQAKAQGIVVPDIEDVRAGDVLGNPLAGVLGNVLLRTQPFLGAPTHSVNPLQTALAQQVQARQNPLVSYLAVRTIRQQGSVPGVLYEAMRIAGVSEDWGPYLVWLMRRESGGNPFAVNPTPINPRTGRVDPRGERATGLFQTLPSTFRAYALPGMTDIFNPLHNAVAAIRYIRSRYGHPANIPRIGRPDFTGY